VLMGPGLGLRPNRDDKWRGATGGGTHLEFLIEIARTLGAPSFM
jgi:hypothetical protein